MGVEGVCGDGQGPPPFPSAPWVGDSVPRRGCLCVVHLERDDAWASRLLAWVQFAQPTFRIVVSGQKLERCFVFICTELEHSPATSHLRLIDPLINLALLLPSVRTEGHSRRGTFRPPARSLSADSREGPESSQDH